MADNSERISEQLSELNSAFSELKTKADILITFTDAHHAIIWASTLDNALCLAILTKMRHLSRDMKDRIFDGYGPLSTFAAKIDIAYALEIIPQEFYDSLRIINRVRVRFAHSKHFLSFQDPDISAMIDSLPSLDLAIADRQERYLKKIRDLTAHSERLTKNQPSGHTTDSEPLA
jgi:DNA-binding MltR family transcriptional regulator